MFTDSERRVYGPYMDGSGGAAVWGDPLKISRMLTAGLGGSPNEVVNSLKSNDEAVRSEAISRVIPAAIHAFELVPFDKKTGAGMLEDDVMKVFEGFCQWMSKKKGKEEPGPTGSNVLDGRLSNAAVAETERKIMDRIDASRQASAPIPLQKNGPQFPKPMTLEQMEAMHAEQKADFLKQQEEQKAIENGKAFEEHNRQQEKALADLMSSTSRVGLPST